LADWWQQFDDPALAELLRLAEADSPSMDQAWANIALARATADSDAADALPKVDGRLSKGRGGQPRPLWGARVCSRRRQHIQNK
jgi:outer membrane protein TolC